MEGLGLVAVGRRFSEDDGNHALHHERMFGARASEGSAGHSRGFAFFRWRGLGGHGAWVEDPRGVASTNGVSKNVRIQTHWSCVSYTLVEANAPNNNLNVQLNSGIVGVFATI